LTKSESVLQEREFERVGGNQPIRANVRLIAATNRDLKAAIEAGQFRSDLYYRLNVFPIETPPLRQRRGDIPLLVRHFAQVFGQRMKKTIEGMAPETMRLLCEYDWPGNVRELQNVIERAVILSSGPMLHVAASDLKNNDAPKMIQASSAGELPEQERLVRLLGDLIERAVLHKRPEAPETPGAEPTTIIRPIERINLSSFDERDRIVRVLQETRGRIGGENGAAARMGLKRTTLITRMKKLGIDARRVSGGWS
jgi:formate hydrogenlyase transcriptional activator